MDFFLETTKTCRLVGKNIEIFHETLIVSETNRVLYETSLEIRPATLAEWFFLEGKNKLKVAG